MQWSQTTTQTPQGPKPAIAPLVISASRATDIPAFHAKWFMNRVKAGYCLWANAFNANQEQYVSFEKCKIFVFWSKNPQPMMHILPTLDERGYQYYFQYTLNDYEKEDLEPRLPALKKRIATFQKLSETLGKHRVIWRYDPIILGSCLTVDSILERVAHLAENLAPYTEKLVFSFLDLYRKTENNLKKVDPLLRPPHEEEMQQLAEGLVRINNSLPAPLILSTCAETLDLHRLGIEHNKCVDPELLVRLCPTSPEIRAIYAKCAPTAQGSLISLASSLGDAIAKDTGQRTPCGCAPSKDIGSYNTCMHLCKYCYANQSEKTVITSVNTIINDNEKL